MNILITSTGKKANLIKYFRRALFNEGGGKIYGMDTDPLIPVRFLLDTFLLAPAMAEAHFESWLCTQIVAHQIDLIIPSRDEDLRVLAPLKDKLFSSYECRLMLSDTAVIETCLDKSLFYKWCESHGFHYPKLLDATQLCQADLPIFIKPKIGSGSQQTLLVRTWAHWQSIQADIDERFLIQSFIDAPEYTIDLYRDLQGKVLSVVPRVRITTMHGESVHGRVELDAQLIAHASRLAAALGLEGHVTIQCFKSGVDILFSEINPRFGGGFTLGVEAGADTPRFIIREHKNCPALPGKLVLQDQLEMVRIQKDIFYAHTDRKVFCFDLDGTLCTESCPYEDAQPMPLVIDKINALFAKGHKIIIATARGASSKRCWRSLTEQQLKAWGVHYHELHTGKPFADFYIDNKAIDVLELI